MSAMANDNLTTRISVRLHTDEKEYLRRLAKHERVSRAIILRRIVREAMEGERKR